MEKEMYQNMGKYIVVFESKRQSLPKVKVIESSNLNVAFKGLYIDYTFALSAYYTIINLLKQGIDNFDVISKGLIADKYKEVDLEPNKEVYLLKQEIESLKKSRDFIEKSHAILYKDYVNLRNRNKELEKEVKTLDNCTNY